VKRQQDAEEFIMKSGDQEAIKMLMLARANPSNYSNVLEGGMNKGNDTLRTALGVMTGVVAGNMISNAITANAISQALAGMETEFETALSDTDLELGGDVGDDEFDIFSCDEKKQLATLVMMDLSRFRAAPGARLSHLSFEGDRAFPAQC